MVPASPVSASPQTAEGQPTGPRWFDLDAPSQQAAALIAAFVVLRLIAAYFVGLGTDEAYSISVAGALHLSYFDHPPMHQWILHLVQPVLGRGRADRLPFIALFAGSSWLMFVLTRRLFGDRAGLWAVLSLNLAGFFTLAAGGWVLPDGPLIFGLLATAATLARGWFPAPGETPNAWRFWLLAGLWLGVAALSKYQAVLFGAGLGVYMLSVPKRRAELLTPQPYVAALITLALLSPVVIWNARHGWASFLFQGGRGAPTRVFHPFGGLEALAGQAAVLLPWLFIPLAVVGVRAARTGPVNERRWFCLTLGAPAIILFTLAPMIGPRGLPHWSMAGWLLLFPLLGEGLARAAAEKAWPRRWAIASAAFLILVGAILVHEDATGWMGAAFPKTFKRGDLTAESIEWSGLRQDLIRRGLIGAGGPFLVALKWNEAGKIDQAVGDLAPVAVFSGDPREFAFRGDPAGRVGRDAVILGKPATVKSRIAELRPYFVSLTAAPSVYVGRQGRREIEIAVVRGHTLLRPYPSPAWAMAAQ